MSDMPMTDAELLRLIVTALGEGRADIGFSGGLESHMDFPGNSETDKGQFIIPGLVLMGLAYWFGNWWLVAASVVLVVAGYFGYWRGVVRVRMRRHFVAKAMADLKLWRKSWSFAGMILTAQGKAKGEGEACRSPQGDWRAFAQGLKESRSP